MHDFLIAAALFWGFPIASAYLGIQIYKICGGEQS